MKTKICTKCNKAYSLDDFPNITKDKKAARCKECMKEYKKEYYLKNKETISIGRKKYREDNATQIKEEKRKHYQRNKNKIANKTRRYREENKEKLKEQRRIYYSKNKEYINTKNKEWREENIDRDKETHHNYYINNKEKIYQYRVDNIEKIRKRRRENNIKIRSTIEGKINHNISNLMLQVLKRNKNSHHWESLVNYTLKDLKSNLEFLFSDGMSWCNYGEWHIDHIIPIASYNFSSYKDEEFKKCWSIDNLRPCWDKENMSKQDNIDWDLIHQIPAWWTLIPNSLEKEMNE